MPFTMPQHEAFKYADFSTYIELLEKEYLAEVAEYEKSSFKFLKSSPKAEPYQNLILFKAIVLLENYSTTPEMQADILAKVNSSTVMKIAPAKVWWWQSKPKTSLEQFGTEHQEVQVYINKLNVSLSADDKKNRPNIHDNPTFNFSYLKAIGIDAHSIQLLRTVNYITHASATIFELTQYANTLQTQHNRGWWYKWLTGYSDQQRADLSFVASEVIKKSNNADQIAEVRQLVESYKFMHEGFPLKPAESATRHHYETPIFTTDSNCNTDKVPVYQRPYYEMDREQTVKIKATTRAMHFVNQVAELRLTEISPANSWQQTAKLLYENEAARPAVPKTAPAPVKKEVPSSSSSRSSTSDNKHKNAFSRATTTTQTMSDKRKEKEREYNAVKGLVTGFGTGGVS